jgi:hypothetical protein
MYGPVRAIYLDPPANTIVLRISKVSIIFDQPTALEDGTIPIDGDFMVDPAVAKALGFNGLKIKAGIYNV